MPDFGLGIGDIVERKIGILDSQNSQIFIVLADKDLKFIFKMTFLYLV